MKTNFHRARELALLFLFYLKNNSSAKEVQEVGQAFIDFQKSVDEQIDISSKDFILRIIANTLDNEQEISELVAKHLKKNQNKVSKLDMSILQLALGEAMLKDKDKKIIINEAVELAKKYGAENSGSFINGLLDNALKDYS